MSAAPKDRIPHAEEEEGAASRRGLGGAVGGHTASQSHSVDVLFPPLPSVHVKGILATAPQFPSHRGV